MKFLKKINPIIIIFILLVIALILILISNNSNKISFTMKNSNSNSNNLNDDSKFNFRFDMNRENFETNISINTITPQLHELDKSIKELELNFLSLKNTPNNLVNYNTHKNKKKYEKKQNFF
jgi:hypothetical protein